MFQPDRVTLVSAAYGQAEQFWDIYFTDLQRAYADAVDDMRMISVDIDADTGELRLNAGYADGSPENDSEKSLFAEYEPSIVEALLKDIPADNPVYTAFVAAAAADQDARHDQLRTIAESLHYHDLDLQDEDVDNDEDRLSDATRSRIAAGREKFFG